MGVERYVVLFHVVAEYKDLDEKHPNEVA